MMVNANQTVCAKLTPTNFTWNIYQDPVKSEGRTGTIIYMEIIYIPKEDYLKDWEHSNPLRKFGYSSHSSSKLAVKYSFRY